MAKPGELLILKYQDFRSDVSRFFVALNKDTTLRNLFFENPTLVIRTKLPSLGHTDIDDQEDELANKFLFSALSNDRFLTFLKEYQEKKSEALQRYLKSPADDQAASEFNVHTIKADFADALLAFGDKELVANIIGRSSSTSGGAQWFIVVVVVVIALAVAMTGVLGPISGDIARADSGKLPIPGSELRKIADQLVASAKRAREAGDL